jgi:hypothetical protein
MDIRDFYIELGCGYSSPVNDTIQRTIVLEGFYFGIVPRVLQSEGEPAEWVKLFKEPFCPPRTEVKLLSCES